MEERDRERREGAQRWEKRGRGTRGREGEMGRGGEETRTHDLPNCLPKTSRLAARRATVPVGMSCPS